jgi:hypothetical protein
MDYPWYELQAGDDLVQGDILESCPVFSPPGELAGGPFEEATFRWEIRDVVIMTQSCDLAKGREKVSEVLLCPLWRRSELTQGHLASAKGLEEVRRGNLPGFSLLAPCQLPSWERELRVVDFRRVYSLPTSFVRSQAIAGGPRLRLLPPYREHLAQAFARFFMRVGLPVDIPSIR